MFGKAVETVEVAPQVNSDATRLAEVQQRRRDAECEFAAACGEMTARRAKLFAGIRLMEACKRKFYDAQSEEAAELQRQNLIR